MNKDSKDSVTIDIYSLAQLIYSNKLKLFLFIIPFLIISIIYTIFILEEKSKVSFTLHPMQNLNEIETNNYTQLLAQYNLNYSNKRDDVAIWNDFLDYLEYSIFKDKKVLPKLNMGEINVSRDIKNINKNYVFSGIINTPENSEDENQIITTLFEFINYHSKQFDKKMLEDIEMMKENKKDQLKREINNNQSLLSYSSEQYDEYLNAYTNEDYTNLGNKKYTFLKQKISKLEKKNEESKDFYISRMNSAISASKELNISFKDPEILINLEPGFLDDVSIIDPILLAKVGYEFLQIELDRFEETGLIPYYEREMRETQNDINKEISFDMNDILNEIRYYDKKNIELKSLLKLIELESYSGDRFISISFEQIEIAPFSVNKSFYWILGIFAGLITGMIYIIYQYFYIQFNKNKKLKI